MELREDVYLGGSGRQCLVLPSFVDIWTLQVGGVDSDTMEEELSIHSSPAVSASRRRLLLHPVLY